MSAYLYTVRTKSIDLVIDGRPEKAYLLKYATKPWFSGMNYTPDRASAMIMGKAEATWRRRGEKPKFVVVGDEFVDGASVYEWDGRAHDYDEPKFDGIERVVGYLRIRKQGRRKVYSLSNLKYDVSVGTMKGDCFHIRLSTSTFHSEGIEMIRRQANAGEEMSVTTMVKGMVFDHTRAAV